MSKEKETIAKAPSGRPKRQPVGLRNKFRFVDKDPAYEYRVAVDYEGTGARIAELKEIGYEFVEAGKHKTHETRVDNSSNLGSVEVLNAGGGDKGYLMRIRKDWYDEDQKSKADAINKTEEGLKPKTSTDGTLDIG